MAPSPAVVVPYDPGWPALFQTLQAHADAALAGVPHVTEHVGSTAVPGLDAKPIVDIDVVAPRADVAAQAAEALVRAGWEPEGDLGVTGREAFRPPAGLPYHHMYVVVAGSKPHRDHLDLRDYLRAHPTEAARYARLKHSLAGLLPIDRDAYTDGKTELITEFLRRARAPAGGSAPAPAADGVILGGS